MVGTLGDMTDQPPFPPAGAPRGPESDDTQPVRPTTGNPPHPFGQPLGPPPPPLTTPIAPVAAGRRPAPRPPPASGRRDGSPRWS